MLLGRTGLKNTRTHMYHSLTSIMVSKYLGRMSSATFMKFIACEAIHNSTLMAQHKDCDLQSSIKAYLKAKNNYIGLNLNQWCEVLCCVKDKSVASSAHNAPFLVARPWWMSVFSILIYIHGSHTFSNTKFKDFSRTVLVHVKKVVGGLYK